MASRAASGAVVRRHRAATAAKWAGIGLLAILLLIGAFLIWLNTDPGRRYIVRQINAFETVSGLNVQVGRIEGSVFGEMILHDVRVSDPKGVFFRAPTAEIDYRPFAYFRNHIDIRSLVIPQARMSRLPELRPADPNAPLLPDIDIDVGRLTIGRLLIDPAVTGRRHLMSLDGRAKIADGRAQVALDAGTIAAPGLAGGDRIALRVDAVPEQNRLDINAGLAGPGNGFVAGLLGVDQAVAARLQGRGDWANWRGRAVAALGGQRFADLAVTARDGTFTVQGPLRPALLTAGPVERLAGPVMLMNLVTTFENRRADLRLRLNSRALAVAVEGLVDLGRNRYEDVQVAARLIEPGAIAPNLSGRDVRLALILNGPFATPGVLYDLRAARLAFGTTTIEGLRAAGSARVRADDIIIPVSARATRILGFDAVAGGTVANVRMDGEIGITGTRLVSDNLRLRSDRIDATLALAFDLAAGRYLAAVQGRVNNYLVDGVGLFDVQTAFDMVNQAGGFGLRGRVAARSRRIDNATVAELLGGPATVTANIAVEPSGLVRVADVRVAAPLLRVTSGSGVYRPNGTIDLTLTGVSEVYGALTVYVTGSATAPRISLRSSRFRFGITDLEADVRATAGGWAITATGQTAYGPFTADVIIGTGRAMTIDIRRLTFAGVEFAGRIVQTSGGLYAGTLTMNGQGLSGQVQLSAAGAYQRVEIAADASGARTPGDVPIILQRGIVRATALLTRDFQPVSIDGDLQLAGLSSGDLLVQRARARIGYRQGQGQVQLLAEGRRVVPFRVAMNARLENIGGGSDLMPDLIHAAMQGQVNNIPFRFAQPAELRRLADGWHLQPVTVALREGRVRLAGRWGDGLLIQSRLDSLDLSILNAFSPGLGIGGRATGSLDFNLPADGSFPRAEARLNIAGFTRSGIATRSVPVDMAVAGSLVPEGGRLAAVIRHGGAVVGRLQAQLQPLGPGAGPWTTRLFAAPLQGGIRYNGPADVLMSFANMPGHQLTGPIAVAADFRGRVQTPQFVGIVRANNLTYLNEQYGTRITNLALTGRFDASRLEIVQLSGRAGDGTVTGQGSIGLASAAGFPIDLRLEFDDAQLARSDDIGATATGSLAIVNDRQGARISGDLRLGEVRYQFVRQAATEVRQLAGVRRRGEPIPPPDQVADEAGVPSIWQLDLRLRADNRIFVAGMGLESEWSADLRVEGTTATPRIVGTLDLIRGDLSLAGRRFEVRRGHVAFTGQRPPNPRIDLEAVSDIEGTEVAINVSGSSTNPQIAFTSSPSLPQDEVVSRILFGSSASEISALQAVQLAASLNTLRGGGGGGLNPLGRLRSATGINRIRILGADETTGRGTAIAAGMYLSDDIYIEIITDAKGFTATQLEVSLSRTLSLLSQFGSQSGTNVNLRYSRDY